MPALSIGGLVVFTANDNAVPPVVKLAAATALCAASAGIVYFLDKNSDTPPATPAETPAQIIPIDPCEVDAFALATRQAKEALISDAYVNRVVEFVCKGSSYRFRLLHDPSDSSCCIAPDLGSETPQALLAHVVNLAGGQSKVSIDGRTINGKSAFDRLAPPQHEPIVD